MPHGTAAKIVVLAPNVEQIDGSVIAKPLSTLTLPNGVHRLDLQSATLLVRVFLRGPVLEVLHAMKN